MPDIYNRRKLPEFIFINFPVLGMIEPYFTPHTKLICIGEKAGVNLGKDFLFSYFQGLK